MVKLMQTPVSDSAIWNRLFQFAGKSLTVGAARSILRLEFSQSDMDRMHELAAKARAGQLTDSERDEVNVYERAGNVLALWKSKARLRLKKTQVNGSRN